MFTERMVTICYSQHNYVCVLIDYEQSSVAREVMYDVISHVTLSQSCMSYCKYEGT